QGRALHAWSLLHLIRQHGSLTGPNYLKVIIVCQRHMANSGTGICVPSDDRVVAIILPFYPAMNSCQWIGIFTVRSPRFWHYLIHLLYASIFQKHMNAVMRSRQWKEPYSQPVFT